MSKQVQSFVGWASKPAPAGNRETNWRKTSDWIGAGNREKKAGNGVEKWK